MISQHDYRESPLRGVRIAQGKSLEAAAEPAKITPSHLSRIERRLVSPSIDVLYALAGSLGLRELRKSLAPYVDDRQRGGQSSGKARKSSGLDGGEEVNPLALEAGRPDTTHLSLKRRTAE